MNYEFDYIYSTKSLWRWFLLLHPLSLTNVVPGYYNGQFIKHRVCRVFSIQSHCGVSNDGPPTPSRVLYWTFKWPTKLKYNLNSEKKRRISSCRLLVMLLVTTQFWWHLFFYSSSTWHSLFDLNRSTTNFRNDICIINTYDIQPFCHQFFISKHNTEEDPYKTECSSSYAFHSTIITDDNYDVDRTMVN